MDILAPELLWIGGCCYRLPNLKETHVTDTYNEDYKSDTLDAICAEEPCDEDVDLDIVVSSSGRHMLKLPISKAFWAKLIGSKGSALRRLEEETRSQVKIPRQHQEGDIEISAGCRRDVLLAKQHIDATVLAARKRMEVTHIVSIPAASTEISTNFKRFQMQVMELCSVPEGVFSKPSKLHWTISPLILTDNRERQIACQRFKELHKMLTPIIAGNSLDVELRGIDIMNDDPAEAHILFARCHNPLLQEIIDAANQHMQGSDFTKKDEAEIKLHVTLMNTKHLDETNEKIDGQRNSRPSFDARPLLHNLRDFHFGSVKVTTIHLSQLRTQGENGYYVPSAIIQLHGSS